MNLQTKTSGEQEHPQKASLIVGGNLTSLCFTDKTGGLDMADNIVIRRTGHETDYMPLTVGKQQIRLNFDRLINEMSGGPANSFISTLRATVAMFHENVLSKYDKKNEQTLRTIASKNNTKNALEENHPDCNDDIGNIKDPQCDDAIPWVSLTANRMHGYEDILWNMQMS